MLVQSTKILGCALALFGTSCMADVGSNLQVPKDAANTCQGHCQEVGMELAAMAIMANNVGCICQFRRANQSAHAEASAAGMATIALQQAAERNRQANQVQMNRPPH